MSQVTAERLSEKRAGEATKDTQDTEQSDDDSCHESDGDDEALGVGASVTEIAKTSKGVKGKKEMPPPAEGVYFTAAGAVHSLMKRSTLCILVKFTGGSLNLFGPARAWATVAGRALALERAVDGLARADVPKPPRLHRGGFTFFKYRFRNIYLKKINYLLST